MYSNYLKTFFIFVLVLALPICGNWIFLYNSGELLTVEEIADKQLATSQNCIVGLSTRNQGYYYKRAMYQKIKPTMLILGSSRVMQFKQDFFNAKIFNAGGAMSSINEGFSFVKDAFQENIPQVMILGIDYWWFNEQALPPLHEIKPPPELSHQISLRSYLLPYKWLWERKLTLNEYARKINPFQFLNTSEDQGIGVDGIVNRNGFAVDGSYLYTKTLSGKEKDYDESFEVSFNNIHTNGMRFEYGTKINDIHFQNFMNMVKYIKAHNVKLILFIPPLAPSVVKEMENYQEHYMYIDDLRRRLVLAGLKVYDFHQPGSIMTNDCEFVDGIHGGDLVYAKILDTLSRNELLLNDFVKVGYIHNVTHHYKNLAMIPRQDILSDEIDFLKMGCDKSTQYVALNSSESKLM